MKIKCCAYLLWLWVSVSALLGCQGSIDKKIQLRSSENTFESGYLQVNGLKMYYEKFRGSGRPLILIHGAGSTIHTSFGKILPLLAAQRPVIGVELQGHGHTADRNRPFSFEQDADDVAALLVKLRIDKADIYGFSNGGNTAIQLAIRHPQLVNKMVIASAFVKRDGLTTTFRKFLSQASPGNMPAAWRNEYLRVAPDRRHIDEMNKKDVARMLAFQDWPEKSLKELRSPALLLFGDHDIVTAEHAVLMSRLIPNSRLLILPGGHGGYMGEVANMKPGNKDYIATAAFINQFLNGTMPE